MIERVMLRPTLFLISAAISAVAIETSSRVRLSGSGPYSFGSGAFGTWLPDEYGAPSYAYTLDQTVDPRATYYNTSTTVNPYMRLASDHWFQLGNDAVVALASNYGYVAMRSDQGSPKQMQDFYPPSGAYGGGIGYLTSGGALLLSSLYNHTEVDAPCTVRSFNRTFGLGYMRKTVTVGDCTAGAAAVAGAGVTVSHEVLIPPGSNSLFVSVVNITNDGPEAADYEWTEHWASSWFHYDFYSRQAFGASYLGNFRNFTASHYGSNFSLAAPAGGSSGGGGSNGGVVLERRWLGLLPGDAAEMARLASLWAAEGAHSEFVGPMQPASTFPSGGEIWDTLPPSLGLFDVSSVGGGVQAAVEPGNDCAAYFGAGGSRSPSGALLPLVWKGGSSGGPDGSGNSCLLMRKRVLALPPGATASLTFVWAMAPGGAGTADALAALAAKFVGGGAACGALRAATVSAFVSEGVRFQLPPGAPLWVSREVQWHSYMTHAALSFDAFWNETILNQGTDYQWGMGFQGAARDPLQHLLPLTLTRPDAAKSILRYTLKEAQTTATGGSPLGAPPFFLPWGIASHGLLVPFGLRPSDLEAYLFIAVGEYVLATGDVAFFEEALELPYQQSGAGGGGAATAAATVVQLLDTTLTFRAQTIGSGVHGIARLEGSDWSDSFCEKVPGCVYNNSVWWDLYEQGESLLTAGLGAYGGQRLAAALHLAGAPYAGLADRLEAYASAQVAALRANGPADGGPWLRRAWLPGVGWQQDSNLEITQQPWHVLAGVFNSSFNSALARTIRENLTTLTPLGPPIMETPFPNPQPQGHQENGGVWQGSLNAPWVWALKGINSSDAWDLWLLSTLANEADVYGGGGSGDSSGSGHAAEEKEGRQQQQLSIWAGIWTSSDAVDSPLSPMEGAPSWDRTPILCTHRHAWPLWALSKLAGFDFDEFGLRVEPAPLPADLIRSGGGGGGGSSGDGTSADGGGNGGGVLWAFYTPRVSVRSFINGSFEGHYAGGGSSEAPMRLKLRLPGQQLQQSLRPICSSVARISVTLRSDDGNASVVRAEGIVRPPTEAEASQWALLPAAGSPDSAGGLAAPAAAAEASAVHGLWVVDVTVPLEGVARLNGFDWKVVC